MSAGSYRQFSWGIGLIRSKSTPSLLKASSARSTWKIKLVSVLVFELLTAIFFLVKTVSCIVFQNHKHFPFKDSKYGYWENTVIFYDGYWWISCRHSEELRGNISRRAKHGGRYWPSIPMNEAWYSPISIIKNDSIHIVTQ